MIEWLIDGWYDILLIVGIPALFVIFLLKGAIVGKFLPTSVFLPGYIIGTGASLSRIALVLAVTSIGYFAGQMCIYFAFKRYGIGFAERIPGNHVTDRRVSKSTASFERYGGGGIFVTNCVPFLGGLLFIPAGVTRYSIPKTVLYGYTSTLLYQTAIVLIAIGAARTIVGYAPF